MLTIVVPTMPGRESLLSRCLWSITDQPHEVDVLVVEGSAGLGDKVNAAVTEASDYVTVVDDDDYLAASYLDCVLPELSVDYVGFRVVEMSEGRYSGMCATSGASKQWDGPYRWPIPKGVTRTDLARQVQFGNEYTADRTWSAEIARLVESWSFIDRGLYVYDHHRSVSFYTGPGQPRDVGMWPYDESKVRRIVVDR